MPVILTAVAKVNDWRALKRLNDEVIIGKVQAMKAVRYRIYRNIHDASEALLVIELLHQDDVYRVRATVFEELNSLDKVSLTNEWVWEPTDWETLVESGREVGTKGDNRKVIQTILFKESTDSDTTK